ncbi:MAG: hypothetical protein WCC87_25995 [Candidatus Korobacteraceae bacterium]
MVQTLVFAAALVVLLAEGWYLCFRQVNRRRSRRILGWIKRAFSQGGSVGLVRWDSASWFHVELRLCPSIFRRAWLDVRLEPREMPLRWLLNRMHPWKETVTFAAELETHPGFNLYVQKHYWRARTCRARPKSLDGWSLHSLDAMVLSTQPECQKKPGNVLDTLLAARSSEFLWVVFRKQAPQFAACAPLQSLSPDERGAEIFDMLHALANSASTSPQ